MIMTAAELILALQKLPPELMVISADDGTPHIVHAATVAPLGEAFFSSKLGDLPPEMDIVLLS
jgi:hypothetical protein